MAGRPLYDTVPPVGDPARSAGRPVFIVYFWGLPPTEIFVRDSLGNPITAALNSGGAALATLRCFRMAGADETLESPLVTKDCKVWALNGRPVQVDGTCDSASSLCEWRRRELCAPRCAPPGARKTSARRLLSLSVPRQVCPPPNVNADAALGYSRRGYQSSQAAFGLCETDGFRLSVWWKPPPASTRLLPSRCAGNTCRCPASVLLE